MASSEGRRMFLLGMTLNELAFVLFFLLMLISSAELFNKKKRVDEQNKLISKLQSAQQSQRELEQRFKKLALLEQALNRSGLLSRTPSQNELDQFFSKLQQAGELEEVRHENKRLIEENDRLNSLSGELTKLIGSTPDEDPSKIITRFTRAQEEHAQAEKNLRGQITYLQNKFNLLKGGRDYPPCWADSETGAIEYLFRIKLSEDYLDVQTAWPDRRDKEAKDIPGVNEIADKAISPGRFKRAGGQIHTWSSQHNCRHFVRVSDDEGTSKLAFKNHLFAIETYFYKFLER